MSRITLVALPVAALALVATTGSTAASTLCVGGPQCYPTLQAAVNAAHDGDTIRIGAGTFAGGVTVPVSVDIVGAGARRTTIRGGGPVLTIGTIFATSEPTVSIDGVTITGGNTTSSPESQAFVGADNVIALGGGIEAPPNADFSGGARLTITNSVVTGNRAAPTASVPFGPPQCAGGSNCPFAWAGGGGIDAWGDLTLSNSTVSNNVVAGDASDAEAAGIFSHLGALTISGSTISDNDALASAPNGRFADSGGIFAENGTVTISGSSITGNTATLNADLPDSVDMLAIAGGAHIGGGVTTASIANTTVSGNAVAMTNSSGYSTAFSGGLHTDGVFTLSNDVIADNHVRSDALGPEGDAGGDSGAGEMAGTLANIRMSGNSVEVSSAHGNAGAGAGATIFTGTLANATVSGNRVGATAPNGSVSAVAGGLQTGGPLTLRNTIVSKNTAAGTGLTGYVEGGGIYAVDLSPNGPPGGPLVLTNSAVVGNALLAGTGVNAQGGGLYVTNSLTNTHSTIAGNTPDDCAGTSC